MTKKSIKKEPIDIDHIANLCRIELNEKECATIVQQLETMLSYLEQLNEVDVEQTEPTLHALEQMDVLRSDEPGENLSLGEALQNAPERKNNQIVVPRIVE
jgi:aspartyl-tRNA(Asn)/glutamyl-tRNA(Gln) amidotransferase subunit C